MSLTVKHLNADASFLLIFSPEAQPSASDLRSVNGAYSILVDPWLTGKSVVAKEWFACTAHNIPPCIQHLSEIDEPDVVVVSQNKPDHCHGETLRQLRPEGKTIIAAEPRAAKAIKKWKHFDPHRVIGLPRYNPKERFSSLRLSLSPRSPSGQPGEVVISFIPAKNYASGLHNAIGITYQPPTLVKTLAPVSTVDLPRRTPYFHMPLSPASLPPRSPPPPLSPGQRLSAATLNGDVRLSVAERPKSSGLDASRLRLRSSRTGSSDFLLSQQVAVGHSPALSSDDDRPLPAFWPIHATPNQKADVPVIHEPPAEATPFPFALPTPPASPKSSPSISMSCHHAPSSSSVSQHSAVASLGSFVTPGRPRPVSVLFAPHGLPFSPDLLPYTQNHLVKLGALPLTLLLHSFDHAQNPWYLGGNIMAGCDGGVQIARGLMARHWVSAHDEAKDDRGLAVAKLVTTRTTPEEVRRKLREGPEGELLQKRGWTCDVRNLGVGAEMFIGPMRDLHSGVGKRESSLLRFS